MESISVCRLITNILHEYILKLIILLYFLYFNFIKIICFLFQIQKIVQTKLKLFFIILLIIQSNLTFFLLNDFINNFL